MRNVTSFRNHSRIYQAILFSLLASAALVPSQTANAGIIASNLIADNAVADSDFVGQSVTTPTGGPWNNITFSFFRFNDLLELEAAAEGTLFVLSTELPNSIDHTPSTLSSSTPGFLAQSTGVVAGVYQFDPGFTLLPDTQYFFYTNGGLDYAFSRTDPYAGGVASFSEGVRFTANPDTDAAFSLSGQTAAVPEPTSLALFGPAIVGLLIRARRRSPAKTGAASRSAA